MKGVLENGGYVWYGNVEGVDLVLPTSNFNPKY
jgi:hypothetical protein